MAECIERKAAIDAVTEVYYDTPDINLSAEKLEAAINGIPAADVAPVVRCKDCTHTTLYEDSEGLYCTNICGLSTYVMDDDYCSYGERNST
jgi:hypothetical protein